MDEGKIDWGKESVESARFDADSRVRELRRELDLTKGKYRAAIDGRHDLEKKIDFYEKASSKRTRTIAITPKFHSGTAESTVIIQRSDEHPFEIVKPEQINGLNESNPDIIKKRSTTCSERTMALIDTHRRDTKIKELVIHFGGDSVTGHIHLDQRLNNAGSPLEECLFAKAMHKTTIDFFLNHGKFDKIHIIGSCGNHSRITDKPLHNSFVKYSYEWMLYTMLQEEYQGEEKLNWQIADGYFEFKDIFGFRCRFHHGYNIRYMGAMGGIASDAARKIHKWNSPVASNFDFFAHHHTGAYYGGFVSNGSLLGYTAYAQDLGCQFEPPRQMVTLIGKNKGIRDVSSIYANK